MKFSILSPFLVCSALTSLSNAATIVTVTPSDLTYVSAQTTLTAFNVVGRANTNQIEVRSRPQAQLNRTTPPPDSRSVVTFANFDISAIPAGATINSATLSGNYVSRLNTVNAAPDAAVGAVATAWDTSGTNNPLFSYGVDIASGATIAINTQSIFSNIVGTAPSGQAITAADFTPEVQAWLDGTLDNNGLAFFINGFSAQGAGFDNVELEIDFTVIPEPSSATLGGLALLCLMRRRRNG